MLTKSVVRYFASQPHSIHRKHKILFFFVALNCVTLILFCRIENPIYEQQKPFTR